MRRRISTLHRPVVALVVLSVVVGCTSAPTTISTSTERGVDLMKVHSPAIEDNMIGEPAERLLAVYLPPGYDKTDRKYPVVYYLPGFGQSGVTIHRWTRVLDPYFEEHPEQAFVLVGVDGANRYGGSFWRDSPITGRWKEFLVDEVPTLVAQEYRVSSDPSSVGIAGFSMGGGAALNAALTEPGSYRAVYAVGPAITPRNDPLALASSGGVMKVRAEIAAMGYETVMENGDLDSEALQAAETTPGVAAAFDREFGGKWMERIAEQFSTKSNRPVDILIEVGTLESSVIKRAVADLSTILNDHGIDHRLAEFPGGHGLPTARVESSMVPFFGTVLGSQ